MFIDADDYVSNAYVHDLLTKLSKHENADMVIGGFTEAGKDSSRSFWKKDEQMVSLPEFKRDFYQYSGLGLLSNVFSKIYKKRLLGKDRFDQSLSIGEDYIFNLNYYSKCQNILFVSNADYFYNVGNATSAMHAYNKNRFACEKQVYCAVKLFRYGEIKWADDLADGYFCGIGIRQVFDICSQDAAWSSKKKEMRAVLEDDLYKVVISRSSKGQGFKAAILQTLCKHRNYNLIRFAVFARLKTKKMRRRKR